MAGASGLAVVLLGGLLAFLLVIAAIGLVVYGLVGAHARRAYRASVVSLVFSIIAVLLSIPFWRVVLTGRDTHGDAIDYGQAGPFLFLVGIESLVLLAAAWGTFRQRRRLRQMPAPNPTEPAAPRQPG